MRSNLKFMKTLFFKIGIFSFLLLTFIACPNVEHIKDYFIIRNNSERELLVYLGISETSMGGTLYPDTIVMEIRGNALAGPVKPNGYLTYAYTRSIHTDTLCFFIFDVDTLEKYSWEEIRSGYKILQRYDLDVTDEAMRKLNFEISYPPAEAMKHIKMYPPYRE